MKPVDYYEGQFVKVKLVSPYRLEASPSPCCFLELISSILEFIFGIDVLQSLDLITMSGEFSLYIWVVRPVVIGPVKWEPIRLPNPQRTVNSKPISYQGHDEITAIIKELGMHGSSGLLKAHSVIQFGQ